MKYMASLRSSVCAAGALCSALLAAPLYASEPETIEFPAEDGLVISADVYLAHPEPETPFIVLFHQAGWSRGEYRESAPRLNALGFNCLAVDQRSGGQAEEVRNETAWRAREQGLDMEYPDALPDMVAALEYAREHFAEGKLLAAH